MRQNKLLVGLDIGTTNVKAAAFLDNGELQAEASASYPTYYPQAGWAEQDPRDWEAASATALTELCARLGEEVKKVVALGMSAHAPGFIPINTEGNSILERIPIWLDERSLIQGQNLLEEIGPEWVGLGMPFAAFGAKLRWFTETHPNLAKKTAYALGVKAYLSHWLTGEYATDPSSEPGRSGEWERLCGACHWSIEKLAPVRPETDTVGMLREDLAQKFGFVHSLPIVLGLNDGASATLGNGVFHPGEGVITLGTNGVIFLVTDQPLEPEIRLRDAIFCWPYLQKSWIVGGQTKSGAASLRWFLGWMRSEASGDLEYQRALNESADVPVGCRGVMFFPYLMGKGTPGDDPSLTGGFLGFSLQTGRATLTRAVLEGVAFTLRDAIMALSRQQMPIGTLMVTGGGARSALWRQILADVLDHPLQYSIGDSCLGAAMLAAVGINLYADIEAAIEEMKPENITVVPQPQDVEIYSRLYREFTKKRNILFELNEYQTTFE
jgi:xylulokinase